MIDNKAHLIQWLFLFSYVRWLTAAVVRWLGKTEVIPNLTLLKFLEGDNSPPWLLKSWLLNVAIPRVEAVAMCLIVRGELCAAIRGIDSFTPTFASTIWIWESRSLSYLATTCLRSLHNLIYAWRREFSAFCLDMNFATSWSTSLMSDLSYFSTSRVVCLAWFSTSVASNFSFWTSLRALRNSLRNSTIFLYVYIICTI